MGSTSEDLGSSSEDPYIAFKPAEIACNAIKDKAPAGYCPREFDLFLCWPPTAPNTTARQACFMEPFNGIWYNNTGLFSERICFANGTWEYTEYESCTDPTNAMMPPDSLHESGPKTRHVLYVTAFYLIGYILSIIALILAIILLVSFRKLRNARYFVHLNLMVAYLFSAMCFIALTPVQYDLLAAMESGNSCPISVVILDVLTVFFNVAIMFWILVEGLHLFMVVKEKFTKKLLVIYLAIGWGGPLVVTVLWTALKSLLSTESKESSIMMGSNHTESATEESATVEVETFVVLCPLLSDNIFDWIYTVAKLIAIIATLVLIVLILLAMKKQRSSETEGSADWRPQRWAIKALLVLFILATFAFLLGLFFNATSYSTTGRIYLLTKAILISIQGFVAALLYCFLNYEVWNVVDGKSSPSGIDTK